MKVGTHCGGKVPGTSGFQPHASVVDLFCGAGALAHGFLLEGFSVACGYDIDDACRFPFESNNGAKFVHADIKQIEAKDIAREFTEGLPRVLAGCAPCQPFSQYSRKKKDPKWKLVSKFAEVAAEVRPEVVTMENVPQLLRYSSGEVYGDLVSTLRKAGYSVRWMVAYCPNFGVPQKRSRLVMIASRIGEAPLPAPTHTKDEYVTVADTIMGMPRLRAGEVDSNDSLHRASHLSDLNLRRIRASKPGGSWKDWPNELVSECHIRETGRGYTSIYGRMEWTLPSPTITTLFYGYGNGRYGHPSQDRAISLREGAALQSFPQHYRFVPPANPVFFRKVGRMIGNAVPVALSRAIAKSVAQQLGKEQ